jgi:hypothetical protein
MLLLDPSPLLDSPSLLRNKTVRWKLQILSKKRKKDLIKGEENIKRKT